MRTKPYLPVTDLHFNEYLDAYVYANYSKPGVYRLSDGGMVAVFGGEVTILAGASAAVVELPLKEAA